MGKEANPNHPGLGKLELALLNGIFITAARVATAYCLRTPPAVESGSNTTMMRLRMPYVYNAAGAKLSVS